MQMNENTSHDKINGSVLCGLILIFGGVLHLILMYYYNAVRSHNFVFTYNTFKNIVLDISMIVIGRRFFKDAVQLKSLRTFLLIIGIYFINSLYASIRVMFAYQNFSNLSLVAAVLNPLLYILLSIGFIIMTSNKNEGNYKYLLLISAIIILISLYNAAYNVIYRLYGMYSSPNIIRLAFSASLPYLGDLPLPVALFLIMRLLIKGYSKKEIN